MMIGKILFEQVSIIFLLTVVGMVCRRKGILDLHAAKKMSDFVMVAVMPLLMLEIVIQDFSRERFGELGLGILLATLFHLMGMALTRFLIRPEAEGRDRLERFAAISSNAGFMGVPLMMAVLGPEGRLHSAGYLVVLTVYFWTHGMHLIKGPGSVKLRSVLTAPGIVALAAGFLIFFTGIELPTIVTGTIHNLTALNTPIPAIITGVYVADLGVREIFTNARAYWVVALRLVVLPLCFIGMMWVMRVPAWSPQAGTVALAMVIAGGCTCAANSVIMPLYWGGDAKHGARIVMLSMAASLVVIPLMASFAQWVFLG